MKDEKIKKKRNNMKIASNMSTMFGWLTKRPKRLRLYFAKRPKRLIVFKDIPL